MTDLYAVFGNPIHHSKSPHIHRHFAEQAGHDMHYTRQLVAVDGFQDEATRFFTAGGKGLNITAPFKLEAFEFASRLTDRARRAGAVNTLARQADDNILGDNTDGIGMIHDMHNLGWKVRDKHILVLGAGGAVRGVLQPLLEEAPASVTIANRTLAKAEQLVDAFQDLGTISACTFDQLQGRSFDVVINGTSASLTGDLPPLPEKLLAADACCYDMTYAAEPTVFLQWATDQGAAHTSDGLGMLVGQAAEAFYIWRQVRPEVVPVITAIRRQLHEKSSK